MFRLQVPELGKHERLPAFRCRCASAYVPPERPDVLERTGAGGQEEALRSWPHSLICDGGRPHMSAIIIGFYYGRSKTTSKR